MSTWLESLDVQKYVKAQMDREFERVNKIQNKQFEQLKKTETSLKAQVSSYSQLLNLFGNLQANISNISNAFNPIFKVSSSNNSIATASITGQAAPGNHALNVTQLAQAEQVASQVYTGSASDDLNMTNTLNFTVGSNNFSLNINSGDSLQTIANNINVGAATNNIGIFASIVQIDANQYQLIVASTQTGVANGVSISETGIGSNALNISTGIGGTGTILQAAQDAQFTLDNISYTLPTNTNLIAGINVSLLSEGSTTIAVTQTNSVENVSNALQTLVTTYNQLMTFITQAQVSSGSKDSTLSSIASTLTNIVFNSSELEGLGIIPMPYGQIPSIIGKLPNEDPITIHPTGLITISPNPITGETLQSTLSNNFSDIQSQLVGNSGILTQINNLLAPPGTSTVTAGGLWIALEDGQYGAIKIGNNQVDLIEEKIKEFNIDNENQKKTIITRYAKLEVFLTAMQNESIMVSQQLEMLSNMHSK